MLSEGLSAPGLAALTPWMACRHLGIVPGLSLADPFIHLVKIAFWYPRSRTLLIYYNKMKSLINSQSSPGTMPEAADLLEAAETTWLPVVESTGL